MTTPPDPYTHLTPEEVFEHPDIESFDRMGVWRIDAVWLSPRQGWVGAGHKMLSSGFGTVQRRTMAIRLDPDMIPDEVKAKATP